MLYIFFINSVKFCGMEINDDTILETDEVPCSANNERCARARRRTARGG